MEGTPGRLAHDAGGAGTFLAFAGELFPSDARYASLPPEDSSLNDLFAFLDVACDDVACSRKARFDVRLAMEELFVNVVRHGFPAGRPRFDVLLATWSTADGGLRGSKASLEVPGRAVLHLAMSDAGVPYDPLAYSPQLVSADLGQVNKVGGLGIHLVRERMDLVEYRFEHGRNVIHLAKRV